MASTRNKNMPGDYCVQQRSYNQSLKYTTNKEKRLAHYSGLPCAGINGGQVPNTIFSNNPTDIESSLFGINSTNLVCPAKPVHPDIKCLDSISFFQRLHAFLPEPLIIQKCQRPHIFHR